MMWGFRVLLWIAVLLTVVAYACSFVGAFVYDDFDSLVERNELHHLFNFHDIIFCGARQNRIWQNISFAINWAISPNETWSFKAFNLMLHLTNGALLFHWLKRIFKDQPNLPWLATAFFLIHPLQIQSVTYVMAVTTLIQAFFYLLALWWYSKYGLSRLPELVMILIASLFAKETCVLIPLNLLIYEIVIRKTELRALPRRQWASLLLLPFLYFPLYAFLKDTVSMYIGTTGFQLYPFWTYFASQLYFQAYYVWLFFDPNLQSLLYSLPVFHAKEIFAAVLGGFVWTGCPIFIFTQARRFPKTVFFLAFFFISYLPTGTFFQMINPFAEYRLYLANIAMCVALAQVISSLPLRAQLYASTCVIGLCAIFTVKNNLIWRDGVSVYLQAQRRFPEQPLQNRELAIEYMRTNRLHETYFYLSRAREFSSRLTANLALDFSILASHYYVTKNYQNAWNVLEKIENDPVKDKLPPAYYRFREDVKKKLLLTKD